MKHCLILLATYNGEKFIKEQLDSILSQKDIKVHVVVSDDESSDNTLNIIREYGSEKITILPSVGRMGSASQNFFRLVRDADVLGYDYIAFSDQDDVWNKDKLVNAIGYIEKKNIDAYSSNVMAFWEDGREVLINKAGDNKSYDYLFSSAGPGCTYVFTNQLLLEFKEQLVNKASLATSIKLHDWLIYAFARSHCYQWVVDETISMRYRQHGSNEFGANSGFKAVLDRWEKARAGWYREQILLIAEFCGVDNEVTNRLIRNTYWDRLRLLGSVFQFRKKFSEALFLGVVLLIPGFK